MGELNGLASRIDWGGSRPNQAAGFVPTISPEPGESIQLVLTSACWLEVNLHWHGGRSVPHVKPPARCSLCEANAPLRWKAFVGAIRAGSHEHGLLPLTSEAVSRCPGIQYAAEGRALRGLQCLYSRRKGHRQGRCSLRLLEGLYGGKLPPEHDLQALLEHLWAGNPDTWAVLRGLPLNDRTGEEGKGDEHER